VRDAPLEPMNDALRDALLRATRGEPGLPNQAAHQIRARLGHDLLATSVALATFGVAAKSTWLTSLLHVALRAWRLGVIKLTVAAVALYGAGYATHATLAPKPAPVIVYLDRAAPAAVTIAPLPSASEAPVVALAGLPDAPALPSPPERARPPLPRDAALAAERLQLESARAALARGDTAATLASVESYQSRFPRGQLREEAEVIAIQALSRAGRTSDARARAALYRARYPNGFFGSAVEEALR
jgi:hypothetical protein